jgi:hypothetical protein
MNDTAGMYEVEIHGPGSQDAVMRLLVKSDSWVEAWREVLLFGIEEQVPDHATCVMHEDDAVHVEVASTGRRFVIRPVDLKKFAFSPLPARGRPVLVSDLAKGGGASGIRVVQQSPNTTRRTRVRQVTAPFEGLQPGAVVTKIDAEDAMPAVKPKGTRDPLARVLSQLEHARLSTRPVRISSQTGLVAPVRKAFASRVTVMKSEPGSTTDDQDRTAPYAKVGALDPLPQQFPAITDPGETLDDESLSLSRALQVCWEHVPCASAQLLKRCGDSLRVVTVRGVRSRELLNATIDDEVAFSQLREGRGAARVRFSEGQRLPYRSNCGDTYAMAVQSLLTVPLTVNGEVWGRVVLINAKRESGFADGELRAVSYLAKTINQAILSA